MKYILKQNFTILLNVETMKQSVNNFFVTFSESLFVFHKMSVMNFNTF